ncbi:Ras guanine-nucleotide exchange Cdc25p [Fusarium pseudocircinatum]|uniref:Ras guanine-nucleotide exchange Cdc25p n=1 Tax=Fusarium pseudocircinatum TaxID=56676 RepID=A0A8H5KNT6_9HYPO|nr:Ras guanine-nucleotide exchange Cdc25p [Fusarium pseudocircinatum]
MEPTAHGFIRNAVDALLILEACLQGRFLHMPRALRPEEARSVVQDGAIFVYEVGSSGIHEWHDHRQWHDEFVLGNFRVSCEADLDTAHLAGRLIRQSITLYWNGLGHHVISYFQMDTMRRVVSRGIGSPQNLQQLRIRDGLVEMQLHLRYSVAYSPWLDASELLCRVSPKANETPTQSGAAVVGRVEGGDIDAIVQGVSNIMVLGYRLDAKYLQLGAWKVLRPITIRVHDRVIVLQKHLGTIRERTPSQGKKGTINGIDLVSAALEIVTKVDTLLSAIQKLHKSHACRSPTSAKSPSTVESGSKTSPNTAAVDASNKKPDSPLVKVPEHDSSVEAQEREDDHHGLRDSGSKAQLGQHLMPRTDDIPPQSSGHQNLIPDLSVMGRTKITQCSLMALIEHLTNCEPQSIREQFVAAFFITRELFCTSEELLNPRSSDSWMSRTKKGSRERGFSFEFATLSGWMAHDSTDASNVVATCRLTNGISNWVKESILPEAEPKSRCRVIERWILIARHLFQLSNFDGLVAVTSGLDDSSVLRLKLSLDAVSVQAKESFRSLRRIVDPSENRKTL